MPTPEPTIVCPKCKTQIKLTESLAAPLVEATKKQYEKQIAEKETDVAQRETAIVAERDRLTKARETIDEQVAAKVATEKAAIVAEESKKARQLLANDIQQRDTEVAELKTVLAQRDAKLADAQKAQAELIRKQRELDDAKREMDLTIERRVQESLGAVREKATKDAEDSLKLKVLEKEEQISSMQRQIEDLRRKAEQGSQQLQGEAQELQLEAILRQKFPRDAIEPVGKGEFGGDILQRVVSPTGQVCGSILWESKRTRNWSDAWLPKLREDQRAAKAELSLLVSHALPKGVRAFDLIDGVWVADPICAIPVAVALRETLLSLATARQAGEGQLTKMELVYQYLTGPRFRHRVEAIVEKFTDLQADLEKERKMMTRLWAKREEQIRGVIESTAGMYGDLQGIAGKTFTEIEGLDIKMLDAPTPEAE